MPEYEKIEELEIRLAHLARHEEAFQKEIASIRREIDRLKEEFKEAPAASEQLTKQLLDIPTPPSDQTTPPDEAETRELPPPPAVDADIPRGPAAEAPPQTDRTEETAQETQTGQTFSGKARSNLEKFIGENIISKVGIVVTIIGVGIGTKYAIDNDLISPLMRIVLGYAVGLALIGFAARLKKNYHNFSAVLMSGGITIIYFVTYFGYGYYQLLSRGKAFTLMEILTAFAVVCALLYERQIIAHIGLVGAYAIPFLLSESSGRADILFAYMAIINVGILAISVIKYWKPLFYSSFVVTWIIYTSWYSLRSGRPGDFAIGLGFAAVFFAIFYATFLIYKLIHRRPFGYGNAALVLLNSFAFYGFGYLWLKNNGLSGQLGLFTVANAALHYLVARLIHRYELGDRRVFYLAVVLFLSFLAIAVPVQFEGHWITLFWVAEAVFLFVIGRTRGLALFEDFSYLMMALSSVSLWALWAESFATGSIQGAEAVLPVFNSVFMTGILFVAGFGVIARVSRVENHTSLVSSQLPVFAKIAVPLVLLIVLYNTFRIEIGNYFYYGIAQMAKGAEGGLPAGGIESARAESLRLFNVVWQINYTLLFLAVLSYVNTRMIGSKLLARVVFALAPAAVVIFLTAGLLVLAELRVIYLGRLGAEEMTVGGFHIAIRYVSYAFLAGLLLANYSNLRRIDIGEYLTEVRLSAIYEIGLYLVALIILSSEVVSWADLLRYPESYKLGLSVLWGAMAIFLIITGIIQKKAHLRIFAISLFTLTLGKLFLYDIAALDTISKTVVFVSIGALLLIASYLYHRYRERLS